MSHPEPAFLCEATPTLGRLRRPRLQQYCQSPAHEVCRHFTWETRRRSETPPPARADRRLRPGRLRWSVAAVAVAGLVAVGLAFWPRDDSSPSVQSVSASADTQNPTDTPAPAGVADAEQASASALLSAGQTDAPLPDTTADHEEPLAPAAPARLLSVVRPVRPGEALKATSPPARYSRPPGIPSTSMRTPADRYLLPSMMRRSLPTRRSSRRPIRGRPLSRCRATRSSGRFNQAIRLKRLRSRPGRRLKRSWRSTVSKTPTPS